MAHDARTDWSMLLGLIFLAIVGGGPWSFDACCLSQANAALSERASSGTGR
jgi:hypothetical protein